MIECDHGVEEEGVDSWGEYINCRCGREFLGSEGRKRYLDHITMVDKEYAEFWGEK